MSAQAVLLDSAILAYALGEDSEHQAACRRILVGAANDELRAYASVEMIQELVHHRLRRTGDAGGATADGRDTAAICTLLNFDREVLDRALDLMDRTPVLRGRDAVHAATALTYGIGIIVSTDRAFDSLPDVSRIDPRDLAAALGRG